jgi:hypothetical protein
MKRGTWTLAVLLLASLGLGCHSRLGMQGGGPGGLLAGGACADCGDGSGVNGACADGMCGDGSAAQGTAPIDAYGADTNYLPYGGRGGPLAALHGRHHRGPQSHLGPEPGPAMGPASPTYGYPYYTTRGPRDFLNPNPPSIGP